MVKMSEFDIKIEKVKTTKSFKRMNHRFLNRIYAHLLGYFWKPCPICGKFFGGHEISYEHLNTIPSKCDRHVGDIICPDCARDGKGRR
jgi:hypothetical protein